MIAEVWKLDISISLSINSYRKRKFHDGPIVKGLGSKLIELEN